MRTDDLIAQLAADTRPVSRHATEQRLIAGLAIGGAATLALIVTTLGLRADLPDAMLTRAFLVKAGYTLSITVIAMVAVARVARPDPRGLGAGWLIGVPVLLLAVLAGVELAATPRDQWLAMLLGSSWRQCSMRVGVLALPIFGGLLWAFRRMAPTRLASAGAAAGLAAGAFSATLYGLYCPEVSAMFVLTWYSLGIVIATAVGALVGPRLLRW